MLSEERFSLAGMGLLAVGLFAALLTWLCVGWFGNQPLLTALIAVVLVEVCLASFALIAMLLTERMTMTLLKSERRAPAVAPPRHRHEPVWIRLHEPVAPPVERRSAASSGPATIAFPAPTYPAPKQRNRAA